MEELRERAIAYATAKGYHQDAEDFAQEALLKIHGGRKATFGQLLVDYLRQEYGDGRKPTGKVLQRGQDGRAKQLALRAYSPLVDDAQDERNPVDLQARADALQYATRPQAFQGAAWNDFLGTLEPEERTILVLHFQWGFSLGEVGHTIGLSESGVSLILKELRTRLKRTGRVTRAGHA